MARRVVSVLRGAQGGPRASDAALEANAYAVAEDLELTIVLRGRGVELAQHRPAAAPTALAGVALPDPAAAADLQGLVESGVAVYVGADCLGQLGLEPADLLRGVRVVDATAVADLLRDADAVLAW
jgi:intracellular sulfur oxidation DsrE/DsrF family protein